MRYLFASAALPPHLDWGGYLATAAELVRRGHDVLWASGEAVREEVVGAGVPFRAVEETGFRWPPPPPVQRQHFATAAEFESVRRQRALDHWLDDRGIAIAADAFATLATAFAPDLFVSEFFLAAAGIAAERAHIPFVVAGWPAHPSSIGAGESEAARARLNRILLQAGARGIYFREAGAPALQSTILHLDYWSQSWFRGVPLLPQTRHAGGTAKRAPAPDPDLPSPDDKPWVLITLGTSFTQDTAFYRMAAQATQGMGCVAIIAAGPLSTDQSIDLATRLPAGCIVRERLAFESVLPWTSAAIHHGGAGTTHALVTHAVPQVVVPHAGDQARQALGVQRSGVGIALRPGQVTVDTLQAALASLLPDRSAARANAQALRVEFAALGGIPRAADMLEESAGRAASQDWTHYGGSA